MIDSLRPVTTKPVPCKICGTPSSLYGVVDFNKPCSEFGTIHLPLCGVPVYYRRCARCAFLFTDAFDDWSPAQFKRHVYNDDYAIVDPDYAGTRPRSNADYVTQLWGKFKDRTAIFDYGGGSDVFCAALRAHGFPVAVSYDPMVPEHAQLPDRKFELITCFETLEHTPDPATTIERILACAADPGMIMYSTLVQPADFDQQGMTWWYVAPRNGHISIFSKQSLQLAWNRHGYNTVSLTDNIHFAFRTLPSYGTGLVA
jgi:Methyltransferase domain